MVNYRLAAAAPQEELGLVPFQRWDLPGGTPWLLFHRVPEAYLLRFPGLADFSVSRDGASALCVPTPSASEGTLRHLFQNQVWPLAMSLRGTLMFHASAVEVGDGAIAFLGISGRGKSTLAASFATSGFRFLTDDGLSVEFVDGSLRVRPSFPSLRLWGDSCEALLGPDVQRGDQVQYSEKARFLAGPALPFCPEACPLRCVYILGEEAADEVSIRRVPPGDALIQLVKHSFLMDAQAMDALAAHFDELARLVNLPIYHSLDFPRRYEELPRVQQCILEHLQELKGRA